MKLKDKIELLKAMEDATFETALFYEEKGDKMQYEKMLKEAMAYRTCIYILTDNKFAEDMKTLYIK